MQGWDVQNSKVCMHSSAEGASSFWPPNLGGSAMVDEMRRKYAGRTGEALRSVHQEAW